MQLLLHNVIFFEVVTMPPRVKFSKDEITSAALEITRRNGIEAVTARDVGAELGVSSRPIFTWFDSMEQLKESVCEAAIDIWKNYLQQGLASPRPFLGTGKQYIRFAREEPNLYKLLFLSAPIGKTNGAIEAIKMTMESAKASIMKNYNLNEATANKFMRNMWLLTTTFATLIVTGSCPYSDEEMEQIMCEVNASLYLGYKKLKGLADGTFDFKQLFTDIHDNLI